MLTDVSGRYLRMILAPDVNGGIPVMTQSGDIRQRLPLGGEGGIHEDGAGISGFADFCTNRLLGDLRSGGDGFRLHMRGVTDTGSESSDL